MFFPNFSLFTVSVSMARDYCQSEDPYKCVCVLQEARNNILWRIRALVSRPLHAPHSSVILILKFVDSVTCTSIYLFIYWSTYFFLLRLEYSMILMVTLKMESCSSKKERLSQF